MEDAPMLKRTWQRVRDACELPVLTGVLLVSAVAFVFAVVRTASSPPPAWAFALVAAPLVLGYLTRRK